MPARLAIQLADGRRAARPGEESPQGLLRDGRRRSWTRRRSAHNPKRATCDWDCTLDAALKPRECSAHVSGVEFRADCTDCFARSDSSNHPRRSEWKCKPGEFYQADRLPDQLFGSGHSLNINEVRESGEQSSWSFQNMCLNPSERMRSSSCTGASTRTR